METKTHNIEFHSSAPPSVVLRGRFILPSSSSTTTRLPLVIMLTGDGPKGTKSLSWTNIPPLLAVHGIASFLFDFEGLGYSDGERAKLTVSRGKTNFQKAFATAELQAWVDKSRLGILASSFGATIALLEPEIVNRVKLLGLKSPASFLADAYANECSPEELNRWVSTGFSDELGYDVEVLRDALRHNVYLSAQQIRTDTLIVHGDKDQVVPVRQSQLLLANLGGNKYLEVFSGVGHNYSEEGSWDRMADLFVTWFHQRL